MEHKQKESYTLLVAHELLRDITGVKYREKTSDKVGSEGPG